LFISDFFGQVIFKLLGPFIDPDTLEKTKVLAGDWEEEVMQWLTKDNLPADSWWGEGKGPKWARLAGSYVLGGEEKGEQTANITVDARNVTYVPFLVAENNYQLHYSVESADYDIEWGVEKMEADTVVKVVEKPKRVDAHVQAHQGIVQHLNKGDYRMVFDNRYSWTTGKTCTVSWYVAVTPQSHKKSQKANKKSNKKNSKKNKKK
jgi:hypothetical protein